MAQKVLTLTDMNNYCTQISTADFPYYEELREAYFVLALSGCRISELFDITRWSYVSGFDVIVTPQKGNLPRNVTLNASCQSFIDAIIGQYQPFMGRTVSQIEYLYNKIRDHGFLSSGDKIISLYLFRYTFIKNLANQGDTVQMIAQKMGYTSISTPQAYLSATLFESPKIDPTPHVVIGSQVWMKENLKIQDNLGGIVPPNNNLVNVHDFGWLYTLQAAKRVGGLVQFYHLPTFTEWQTLATYLGGNSLAGGKLKSINPYLWDYPNTGASDLFNFGASGAGEYAGGIFSFFKHMGYYWHSSSNPSSYPVIFFNSNYLSWSSLLSNQHFSVRLIRDYF